MRYILTLLFTLTTIFASTSDELHIKQMIGQMLLVGFENSEVDASSKIIYDINKYKIGGVILFDRFYDDRTKTKNISSPAQVQKLTSDLQKLTKHHLIISVDQEGGKVARLKPKCGFEKYPSARDMSIFREEFAKNIYTNMAETLKKNGFNCNFAPVVDLAVNPENKVIYGLERSFGATPNQVVKYATILIEAQKKFGVLSVLKHFPGHGSSLGDSHLGFVDVSETWSEVELKPYQKLIDNHQVDMIMTAHVFNKYLDKDYPATLSYNVNTKLLREKMLFQGVIISDDLQMKAISKHYSLKESVRLAINAGVDILLFGNQLAHHDIEELVNTIYTEVQKGNIPLQRIKESNMRIQKLYE